MQTFQYLLFLAVARIVQVLPLGAVRRVATLLAWFLYHVLPIRRALTLQQLRKAFPEHDEKDIRRIGFGSYVNLMTTLLELMWTPRLTDEVIAREIRIVNREVFDNAIRRGKGVILMSGHFGNWEWLSIASARLFGHPYAVVVHSVHNPGVDALVEHWRCMHGNRVVPMGISIREIVKTLRERGVVAMLADQSGPSGSLYVRYFGRWAATYEGPAMFSLRTGAPIIMGFGVRRDDGGYDISVQEIETSDLKGLTDEHLRELTRRHVRALEAAVTEHPDHWLWQHKRWKHQPHAESVLVEDPRP